VTFLSIVQRKIGNGFAALNRRPLMLPALGAALGLLLAVPGLFHLVQKPVTQVPSGYIALVNGQPILLSDYIGQTETTTGAAFADATQRQRRDVLHQMIDEELLVQRGLTLNLPETDTDVRAAMVDSVNAQAAAPVLDQRPTDDVLRAYFRAHLTGYTSNGSMRFHDLLLRYGSYQYADQTLSQAEADAAEAVFQLRAGSPLDAVKEHFGLVDSLASSPDDDALDFAARIHLGLKLFGVASALSDGEISNPVADKDGVHIVLMEHRQAPVVANFDNVRNNVYSDYINQRRKDVQQDALAELRKRAKIILAPDASE
jgi:parvulin-like peptidyl-prolyl isomerase